MIKATKTIMAVIAAVSTISAASVNMMAASNAIINTSKYPDVPTDVSYFDAVNILSSLDIISGFDDGSFRPDELVTRAQMAKMIVEALNESEQVESSKALSQFTDVTNHWAKGYINQGVFDTFISGYGDGTFGPDDNVTFVQAQSMLVRAIGYSTYAEGSGGYPNGYKTWADSQGITYGMTGLPDDKKLIRAEVAKLIYNTMNAPVCVIKDYDTTLDGRRVPNLDIKDGEGMDFQNLFTKRHDVFKVKGYLKNNETFVVTQADNFDDGYYPNGSSKEVHIVTNIGWSGGKQVVLNDYYGSEYLNIPSVAFLSSRGGWGIVYMTGDENSDYSSSYDTPVKTPKPTTAPTPKPTATPKVTVKPTTVPSEITNFDLTYEDALEQAKMYVENIEDDISIKGNKKPVKHKGQWAYEFELTSEALKSNYVDKILLYVYEGYQFDVEEVK